MEPGLGYVDVFNDQGKLLLRFQHGSFLNAPLHMVRVYEWVSVSPDTDRIARIDFTVGAFQIDRSQDSRSTVPWAREKNHFEIVSLDEATEMGIQKGQARA